MRRTFTHVMIITLIYVLPSYGLANVSGADVETHLEHAATLFGSIRFDSASEEAALRHLTEVLLEEPANVEAQKLVEAIQRRRSEQEQRDREQGQQHIDQQQDSQQDNGNHEQQRQDAEDEREDGALAADEDNRIEQPDENDDDAAQPSEQDSRGEMTEEEAIRLLDALEAQEKAPQIRHEKQDGSRGPRW